MGPTISPPLERGVAIALLTPGLRDVGVAVANITWIELSITLKVDQMITWGAGVRGGSGGPLSSSSPATSLVSVSSLPGVSTSSMSHTFKISYFEFEQLRWNHHLGLAYQCALFSFVIFLTSLDWEFGVVTRVGEGSLSLHGESTAGEERWEGESSDALGGASGVVG